MAATLTQERFTGPEWIFERKIDGIRLLAFKNGSDVRLYSRNRLPQNIPPVVEAIAHLPVHEVITDGEITWGPGKLAYHVFDILWLDGHDVTSLPLDERRALLHHPLVTDTRSLLWITNQNTITQHVWTLRAPNLYHPDICVFDLDPSEDDPAAVRAAALALRDLLTELGLPSWVKTSGSKGFHIVVPLDGKARMGEAAGFAHAVGRLFVQEVGPRTFTLRTMAGRIADVGDLWSDMRRRGRSPHR